MENQCPKKQAFANKKLESLILKIYCQVILIIFLYANNSKDQAVSSLGEGHSSYAFLHAPQCLA